MKFKLALVVVCILEEVCTPRASTLPEAHQKFG